MVNENRVRIMTALASYEKRHKEELQYTEKWFRGDYIGIRMLKNGCRLTLAFLVGTFFYMILNMDELLDRLNTMDILPLAGQLLTVYGVVLAIYLLLTYLVFSVRYYQAEKRRRTYVRLVERLEAEYRKENKAPARRRTREGHDRRR